jgi:peroxiredoxin
MKLLQSIFFLLAAGTSQYSQAAEAAKSDAEVRPLLIGATAPTSVSLQTIENKSATLSELLKGQPAVLVFYRGGWCPYCNLHLSELRKVVKPAKDLGFQLIAISPDQPELLFKQIEKAQLDYTLISDSSAELINSFGIGYVVDEKTRAKLMGFGIDLAKSSGHEHFILPVPAIFVLDGAGKINYQYVNPDYSVRLSADVLLAVLKDIHGRVAKR